MYFPEGKFHLWPSYAIVKTNGGNVFSRDSKDKKLVKRLLSGDENTFHQFFQDYFPRLFRFALALFVR